MVVGEECLRRGSGKAERFVVRGYTEGFFRSTYKIMADETTGKVEEVKGDEHVGSNAKEGAGAELVPSQAKVSEGPPGVDGKPEEVSEENRLWQIVQRNPTDFSTWTQLLEIGRAHV